MRRTTGYALGFVLLALLIALALIPTTIFLVNTTDVPALEFPTIGE